MRAVLKFTLLTCALPISGIVFAQQALPPPYAHPRIVLAPPGYYVPQVQPVPSPFGLNPNQSRGLFGRGAFAGSAAGQVFETRGPAQQHGQTFVGAQGNSPFKNVPPRTLKEAESMSPP